MILVRATPVYNEIKTTPVHPKNTPKTRYSRYSSDIYSKSGESGNSK